VLNRDDLVEIRRVDRDGRTLFVANDQGLGIGHLNLAQNEAGAYLSWASDVSNRGEPWDSAAVEGPAFERRQLVMDLIIPTYEDSSSSLHPQPSHGFAGYLKATLDVSRLLLQIVPAIRSGKSGYAWVLDSSGIFLYHRKAASSEKTLSMFAATAILKFPSRRSTRSSDEMMKGKEGREIFIGWHREVIESMEKFIGYALSEFRDPIWTMSGR